MSSCDWTPIGGEQDDAYHGFSGSFDGDIHTISDMSINMSLYDKEYHYFGFIEKLGSGAVLKNLILEDGVFILPLGMKPIHPLAYLSARITKQFQTAMLWVGRFVLLDIKIHRVM